MRKSDRFSRIAILFALVALVSGCASFWERTPGVNGAATRPSPAETTAAILSTAAAATTGAPVSPFLSFAASALAIIAAAYSRSHSSSAKRSACQAGVLFEALQTQGKIPPQN
jgi:hypothetical protein